MFGVADDQFLAAEFRCSVSLDRKRCCKSDCAIGDVARENYSSFSVLDCCAGVGALHSCFKRQNSIAGSGEMNYDRLIRIGGEHLTRVPGAAGVEGDRCEGGIQI